MRGLPNGAETVSAFGPAWNACGLTCIIAETHGADGTGEAV
jgi:hypothetical protein